MTSLFRISAEQELVPVARARLGNEALIESWVAKDPSLIGLDILVLGTQVVTDHGGRIDLLGMDADGNLVVVELKRDRTPRDVVAQVLDYASWICQLTPRQVGEIAMMKLRRPLEEAFRERFDAPLPDAINTSHSMVIVASEFDSSSKRIVEYLAEQHGLSINAAFFNVFEEDGQQYLATDWLLDQETVVERAEARDKEPWTGVWYVNAGEGPTRTWADQQRYSFTSAGQGPKRAAAMRKLGVGDRFYSYQSGHGYVGFGEVVSEAVMATDFIFEGKPILECELTAPEMDRNKDNPDLAEWVVGVRWLKTLPMDKAVLGRKPFFFARNIVCKLRDRQTLDELAKVFGPPDALLESTKPKAD